MYLSPGRYRTSGFGIDVSDVTDSELRAVLARASSLVDVYCGIPMQPSRHDFRGGSITGEQHEWRLATDLALGARRVYLIHRPIKAITAFKVKFTNDFSVTIAPNNLYINHIQGWAEVVSLAAVVSGVYPVGVNFGLYTPVAEVDYTYGYSLTMAGDRLYSIGSNVYQATRGSWAASPAPVIYRNGAIITAGFTVDALEGTITFASAQSANDVFTADYTYTLPDAIVDATAITATHLLSDREINAKGMGGLTSLKVSEITMTRNSRSGMALATGDILPDAAASLLAPYAFRSMA